ncbi:hypothetical protein LAZ67_1005496, partial [Cordylochernes scorpioides]
MVDDAEADRGIYTCRAGGPRGLRDEKSLVVTVRVPPMIIPFESMRLRQGSAGVLTCAINRGEPPLDISWQKNGEPLAPELGLSLQVHALFSLLAFANVGRRHAANYTCVVKNTAGSAAHSALVVVDVPPRWVVEPSNSSVVQGQSATLDCQAEGEPPPVISWKRATGERQNKNNLDRHFGNEEPKDEISLTTCGLVDPPFSENEVKLTAFKFGKRKSPGPEGIDNTVVKALVRMHPSLLSRLFNRCLDTGTFPEAWKVARVVLLEKSGRKGNSPNDYRMLSLLACLGKVLDSLLAQRLKHWLESNELLSSFQHGFREGKSTTTALNEVLEGVEMGLNKGAWVLFVALDIDGAFNSMNWNKLMRNLMDMGCPDNLCSLVRDFLGDRRISLSFGGRKLERNCARGCPQGSCCGPILWNILVNTVFQEELPEGARLVLYADDQEDALGLEAGALEWKRDPRKPPQWLPKWNWSPGEPTGIGTEVFTDGSKSGTNTGAGVVIFTNGELIFQESLTLRVDELVFSAELVAIKVARRVCAEKNFSPDRLYSDCMSALVALNLVKGQLAHQIIQELEMMTRAPELPWFRRHSLIE